MQKRNVRRTSQRGERSRSTEQTKADEADYRSDERAAAGWGMGGKIPGGALAERLLEAELTQKADAFSCAKGTKNDQIEDERTRRGGRADETGGLVGGRGGVRTGKAQPPRGRASSEEGGQRPALLLLRKQLARCNDVMLLQLQP